MSERIIRFKTCLACSKDFQCPKKIGLKNWNKRKFCSINCSSKNFSKGIYSNAWKENPSYAGLHKWLNREMNKPNLCEFCKSTTSKRYEWANISKEYKRDFADWFRLCASCHRKYDKNWEKRKRNNLGRFI